MAKLPNEILTTIFGLQQNLIESIHEATATAWTLLEQYGETDESIPELEELQNTRERVSDPYSRLSTLLIRTAESQPTAANDILNLLARTIEQAQAAADASQASVREIKRNWNLP